jgi:8-oxo-dGTP pyrophosphatase MutT (NUDIX family)
VSAERTVTLTTEEARQLPLQHPAEFNGSLAPLDGIDADRLRQRFRTERPWQQEMLGDGQFTDLEMPAGQVYKQAAVLVPLVVRDVLSLLLTQRPLHLKHHPGQISFPGGRKEDADADLVATALRETREEIGLAADRIEVIGTLPQYLTVTNYQVTPVVGLVHLPFDLALDANEVADAFEVPLSFILNPANHERRARLWQGRMRHFYAIPFEDRFIWGATAAMLRNLYHFLRA